MSLLELLRLLPFAPATRSHSRPPISLHEPEFFGAPRSLPCVDPKVESAQQKTPPMRAFAQRRHHSRASVAHHEQLAIFSMNRAEPSVNVQVRLKYQDYLKNPVELGPGMHHRSARPHQAADTSAPGQPARTRTLGTIRLRGGRGGSLGPRGHAAGVMAGRCGSARHVSGRAAPVAPLVLAADGERPKDSRRARSRQRSSPASSSNRGADNNHYFSK